MEAATEFTIQEPAVVLKELQSAMGPALSSPRIQYSGQPKSTEESKQESSVPAEVSDASQPGETLIDIEPIPGDQIVHAEVAEAVKATREPVIVKLPGKKPVRVNPSANLPHKPSDVKQWVGTVQPSGASHPTDMDAGDTFGDRDSLYEDPPAHEEEMPSDAGSVRSELNMFKLYVEGQLEETRRYMEEQMRSTHNLLTKIDTRLAILEKKVNLPASRPTSISLPVRPVPVLSLTQPESSKAAAQTASASTVTLGGGLTELPLYSPNKVIQVRTLNRQFSSQHVTLQPISKAIPRKDWNLQYLNSLPVYKY